MVTQPPISTVTKHSLDLHNSSFHKCNVVTLRNTEPANVTLLHMTNYGACGKAGCNILTQA